MNNIVFDFKLPNGEVLEGVHFVEYRVPLRSGNGLERVMTYIPTHIKCFKGEVEVDLNWNHSSLIKAYDSETGEDKTVFLAKITNAHQHIEKSERSKIRFPIIRNIVKLN